MLAIEFQKVALVCDIPVPGALLGGVQKQEVVAQAQQRQPRRIDVQGVEATEAATKSKSEAGGANV